MNKAEDEMRAEYRREDLGKGVRGKYFDQVSKGTNLVFLDDRVSKAFPTAEAVNPDEPESNSLRREGATPT